MIIFGGNKDQSFTFSRFSDFKFLSNYLATSVFLRFTKQQTIKDPGSHLSEVYNFAFISSFTLNILFVVRNWELQK